VKEVFLHKPQLTPNIAALDTKVTDVDDTGDKLTGDDEKLKEPATPVNVWSWSFIYDGKLCFSHVHLLCTQLKASYLCAFSLVYAEYMREEVVVILAVSFGTFFNEIALEVGLIRLSRDMNAVFLYLFLHFRIRFEIMTSGRVRVCRQ
jgi:hypothetical protein